MNAGAIGLPGGTPDANPTPAQQRLCVKLGGDSFRDVEMLVLGNGDVLSATLRGPPASGAEVCSGTIVANAKWAITLDEIAPSVDAGTDVGDGDTPATDSSSDAAVDSEGGTDA